MKTSINVLQWQLSRAQRFRHFQTSSVTFKDLNPVSVPFQQIQPTIVSSKQQQPIAALSEPSRSTTTPSEQSQSVATSPKQSSQSSSEDSAVSSRSSQNCARKREKQRLIEHTNSKTNFQSDPLTKEIQPSTEEIQLSVKEIQTYLDTVVGSSKLPLYQQPFLLSGNEPWGKYFEWKWKMTCKLREVAQDSQVWYTASRVTDTAFIAIAPGLPKAPRGLRQGLPHKRVYRSAEEIMRDLDQHMESIWKRKAEGEKPVTPRLYRKISLKSERASRAPGEADSGSEKQQDT